MRARVDSEHGRTEDTLAEVELVFNDRGDQFGEHGVLGRSERSFVSGIRDPLPDLRLQSRCETSSRARGVS